MKKIEKILLPVDFGPTAENAFTYALLLADSLGASIDLVHCAYLTHPSTIAFEGYPISYEAETLEINEKRLKDFVADGLTRVLPQLKNAPPVNSELELGDLGVLIKTIAKDKGYDLIIMGTKGAHNFWRKLLGSNSVDVIYNAPCPVLVIPDDASFQGINRLCFATDLDHIDALASNELLSALEPFHPALDFVHVQDKPGRKHAMDMEFLRELVSRRLADYETGFHLLNDSSVAASIIDFAKMTEASMIVMPRPHYNFLDLLFHKSYTREVAHRTELPLLVLNAREKSIA